MARPGKLPFAYRLRWNIQYALLTVVGPASLGPGHDPRDRMRAERAATERRVAREREARDR